MTLLPIGTKVDITLVEPFRGQTKYTGLKGVISGYGMDGNVPVYLVSLDKGRYLEDKATFVSTLVVHPSNVNQE